MKIIFCVSSVSLDNSGGMNRVIADVLPILRHREISYVVICPKSFLNLCKGLIRLITDNPFSYDYVVFNSLASVRRKNKHWKVLYYLSKVFSWKKIIYWHEMPSYFEKYRNSNKHDADQILRKFNRKDILHLTVSESNSKLVDEFFFKARKKLIYNTIEAKRLVGNNRFYYPTILTIGSIQSIKGTDIWTKVAVAVCNRNSDAHFIWCGGVIDRRMYDESLKMIVDNNLNDRINFIGYINNPAILFHSSHLYYLPSRSDSMPLVILEAMACGKDIVYYASGGVKEEVGDFGIFIENFSIENTVESILKYLASIKAVRDVPINENLRDRFDSLFRPEVFVDRFLAALGK